MKQREAVYNATLQVMGEQDGKYEPTSDQRKQIIEVVAQGLISGEVDFSESAKAKYDTEQKVRSYASGLVSNWLRKDPNLNGGETYQPKNPGSRIGSQDEQVKAMRALLKSGQLDEEGRRKTQEALDQRINEIKAEKAQQQIDVSKLPQHLVDSLGLDQHSS